MPSKTTCGDPSERRPRLGHDAGRGSRGRLRALCPDRSLWPAACRRDRGRPPGRAGAGRRPPCRARHRPPRFRRQCASLRTLEVPKDRTEEAMTHGIPITYVPARNTVFLALALAWAESSWGIRHLHRRQLRRLLGLSRLPAGISSCVRAARQSGHARGRRRARPLPDPRPALDAQQGADHRARARARRRFRPDAQLLRPGPRQALPADAATACRIRRSAFERLGLEDPDRLRRRTG